MANSAVMPDDDAVVLGSFGHGWPSVTVLAAEIAELEALPRFDRDGAGRRAELALTAVRAAGLLDLEMRLQLVLAEVQQRGGEPAKAGRQAQEVLAWATEHGATFLLSRGHYVLQNVYLDLGDLSLALEHSVRAVELMGEHFPAVLRFDHLCRLADCLGLNHDAPAARARYPEAQRLAEQLGDVDRLLVLLNNWAYIEYLAGAHEDSYRMCLRILQISAAHGKVVPVGRLDTIARALMGLGRLAEAEEVLLPCLDPRLQRASTDGDEGADCLLTLAEVQRQLGKLAQAQQNLDDCVGKCEDLGLVTIRVHARQEQAELHAAAGDFRAAFEEHKIYSRDVAQLHSDQRDARARALQALYETTEARRQSRRYREMSLRDPLTGLYNRRFVDEELPRLLRDSATGQSPVAVALLDLDHFKNVNDGCSHEVGDDVLRAFAGQLEDAADRAPDGSFVARLGGEEFLLVLVGPVADPGEALERFRAAIADRNWAELTGDVPVTVSIGWTRTAGRPAPEVSEMLSRADACLYRAKRGGRNRVVTDGS